MGMNQRNTQFIQAVNPRRSFPLVDDKERMHTITITKISDTEMSVEGDEGKKAELTKKK